nr:hypothetical protein [Tanacetum cinerariifolium]
ATVLPQTNVLQTLGADEAVNQEEGNRVERAITTDASLEAAQDSDNIIKTQTTAMPNVNIPQGIYTGGSLRCQETMGEGHISGSGEGSLKENIKLMDTLPTPHDSPLTGGYTPGSDEGRITLGELMETCKTLSNMVTQLETELSTSKAVYNKAFITLTNRVKKLESQLKQKRIIAVIYSLYEEGPRSLKKQRLDQQTEETEEEVEAQGDSDQEVEELKLYMRIIHEEYIAIEAIPLAIKPLVIIEYKMVKEGKNNTYHITRVDGSTRRYTSMINLLKNINKEDLETLWKLLKDKYGNT